MMACWMSLGQFQLAENTFLHTVTAFAATQHRLGFGFGQGLDEAHRGVVVMVLHTAVLRSLLAAFVAAVRNRRVHLLPVPLVPGSAATLAVERVHALVAVLNIGGSHLGVVEAAAIVVVRLETLHAAVINVGHAASLHGVLHGIFHAFARRVVACGFHFGFGFGQGLDEAHRGVVVMVLHTAVLRSLLAAFVAAVRNRRVHLLPVPLVPGSAATLAVERVHALVAVLNIGGSHRGVVEATAIVVVRLETLHAVVINVGHAASLQGVLHGIFHAFARLVVACGFDCGFGFGQGLDEAHR